MAWQPGQSGNPGGRPKENAEVKALAREHCKEAIERLVMIMRNPDDKLAKSACDSILDRGIGKPTQVIAGDEDMPPAFAVVERRVIKGDEK